MALQSSGAISISQIRTELGSASGSLRTLSSLAGKAVPDAMSEFYGYSALPPPLYWDGNFTAGWSGVTGSDEFFCLNYAPNYAYVFDYYGDGAWSFGSDATAGWDGYVNDHDGNGYNQAINNFYFVNFKQSGITGESIYIYLTPPSGRGFVAPIVNNNNVNYSYYDLSSSTFNVSYSVSPGTTSSIDFFFYLQ